MSDVKSTFRKKFEKDNTRSIIKEKVVMLIEKGSTLTCLEYHQNKYNKKDHNLNKYQESVNPMYSIRKESFRGGGECSFEISVSDFFIILCENVTSCKYVWNGWKLFELKDNNHWVYIKMCISLYSSSFIVILLSNNHVCIVSWLKSIIGCYVTISKTHSGNEITLIHYKV